MTDPLTAPCLQPAIEHLYYRFESVPPAAIDGCPCCLHMRGVDALVTTPLRDIGEAQLFRYVSGVFLTVGAERDFRYLLPRILEIAATRRGSFIDPSVTIGKLGLAGWQAWAPEERAAVEAVIDRWFLYALSQDAADADAWGPVGMESEGILCGAVRAGLGLERFRAPLYLPFAAPVLDGLRQRCPDTLSGFWDDVPGGVGALAALLA